MMRTPTHGRSPVRLQLYQLETRDTPSGTVTTTFAGGVLTLTGDDDSNVIQLLQTPTGINVAGIGTTIDGDTAFTNVKSVKAVMKGGNDEISTGPIGPITLTAGANIDLGDGNNTLVLTTIGVITLGSLTVKAGDGDDSITVSGLLGSKVTGTASFDLKAGDTDLHMTNLEVAGIGGFKFNATDGADSVTLTRVTVTKAATISTGLGPLDAEIFDGTFGSLSLTGTGVSTLGSSHGVNLTMSGTVVTGSVQVKSQTGAVVDLTADTAKTLSVTGATPWAVQVTANGATNLTGGGITAHGGVATLTVAPGAGLDATGDIALLATDVNDIQVNGGTMNAAGVRLTASQGAVRSGLSVFSINSGSVALDRDIALTGRSPTLAVSNSTVTARNATITGSIESNVSQDGAASPSLSLSGKLTIHGPEAALEQNTGDINVGGNLTISGSRASDLFGSADTNLEVGGTLSINAGAGQVDALFSGAALTVTRDLTVAGQHLADIGLNPSAASTIGGNAKFTLGADDDDVTVNSNVAMKKNLTINVGAGINSVTLGTSAGDFAVGGNLSVTSLGGDDAVTLNRPAVTGTTKINTGAGADLLQMNGPETFTGATTIDLGAGDDTWNAANDPGTTTDRVRFAGTVNAKLGAGNDTLRLGLADASGGNAFTTVDFASTGVNKIDGGTGLNLYDPQAAKLTGTVTIVNFEDPTP